MNTDRWVNWQEMVNKSKHQTLQELREFLMEKGLLTVVVGGDPVHATRKAWYSGFVKEIDGQELWHLKTYISMMQSHHKVLRLQKQKRPIAKADYKRALIELPKGYSEKEDYRARFEHAIGR